MLLIIYLYDILPLWGQFTAGFHGMINQLNAIFTIWVIYEDHLVLIN